MRRGIVVMLLLAAIASHACDVCGSFFGVTPYDNQSGITLLHRYRLFSKLDIQGQPFMPHNAYRLQQPVSPQHVHDSVGLVSGDFESFKVIELRGKWFIHSRVELNVIIPFMMTRSRMHGELEKLSGIGDPTLSFGYHLIRPSEADVKHRLILGIGIKFPLGKNDVVMQDGDRFHFYLQPGTGSFDELVYAQYSLGVKKLGFTSSVTAKYNGTNVRHEQLAPSFTMVTNVFYVFKKGTAVILPQVQFYGEHTEGYSVSDVHQPGSKMSMFLGGIGCDAYFGRLGVHLSAQLPLQQYRTEDAPGATLRAIAGLSWNINQTEFLLN